jgi:hypothetical protein
MSAATATVSRFAGVNRRALGLAIFYLILAAIIVVGFVPGTCSCCPTWWSRRLRPCT